jgi:hypothetical protein
LTSSSARALKSRRTDDQLMRSTFAAARRACS